MKEAWNQHKIIFKQESEILSLSHTRTTLADSKKRPRIITKVDNWDPLLGVKCNYNAIPMQQLGSVYLKFVYYWQISFVGEQNTVKENFLTLAQNKF